MKTDQFYTVKTLADRLAIRPVTIYRMVERGTLPAVRIGKSIRFNPQAIDAFLETVRVGPGGLAVDEPKEGKHEKRKG